MADMRMTIRNIEIELEDVPEELVTRWRGIVAELESLKAEGDECIGSDMAQCFEDFIQVVRRARASGGGDAHATG